MAGEGIGDTASVVAIWPAIEALAKRGAALDRVLTGLGLTRERVADADTRIPYADVLRFWEAAARAAHDAHFGVHVASKLPVGGFDLLDFLLSTSATLGEGYARVVQFARVVYDGSRLRLERDGDLARLVRPRRAHQVQSRQFDEFVFAVLVARGRQTTGVAWHPERVRFLHQRPVDGRVLRRFFGAPVELGAGIDELWLDRELLALPQLHSSSRLHAVLVRYANQLLRGAPAGDDFVARARHRLVHEIGAGRVTMGALAKAMRVSPRSLQRRLKQHGTSHRRLVDDVRRGLALEYIVDPRLALAEISYLLCFSDQTAFHRAFRRWTGTTPLDHRNRQRHPARRPGSRSPRRAGSRR